MKGMDKGLYIILFVDITTYPSSEIDAAMLVS